MSIMNWCCAGRYAFSLKNYESVSHISLFTMHIKSFRSGLGDKSLTLIEYKNINKNKISRFNNATKTYFSNSFSIFLP